MENLPLLYGPHVCEYTQRRTHEPTQFGEESNKTDVVTRLIRNCCPGYESSFDKRRCLSKMDFLNPFKGSDNFSLAIVCLAIIFFIMALLSMFIAYKYYYRFRIGRKSGILTEDQDLENHDEGNFVVGFTMTQQHYDDNPYKQIVVS